MDRGTADQKVTRTRAVRTLVGTGVLTALLLVGLQPPAQGETLIDKITKVTLLPKPKPKPKPTTTTTEAPSDVPRRTELATPLMSDIPTYDNVNNRIGMVGTWFGHNIVLPVIDSTPTWVQVRLPERPNGSTAWVRRSDVAISTTQYRIVIDRSDRRLTVYDTGFASWSAPVGLGTAATPTPLGSFSVGVIERDNDPGYGPIVLDLTAHSEAIDSWQGSGDAIIAIHGPISNRSDALIGTTGTYNTNGCVRMHLADQVRLEGIPLGTPVDIVE